MRTPQSLTKPESRCRMSRSNYDKPFYVDIGTSIAAVRCASNHDVVYRRDYMRYDGAIKEVEELCDRLNKECELFYPPRSATEKGASDV